MFDWSELVKDGRLELRRQHVLEEGALYKLRESELQLQIHAQRALDEQRGLRGNIDLGQRACP